MEYFDTKINSEVSARIYYSHTGRQIYLIDNSTDEEVAEVKLLSLDFGDFCDILNNKDDNNK